MPVHKLDPTFCLLAQCEPGQKKTLYRDTQITGFGLECRSSGRKTFALSYTDAQGKQRQHKIGRFEDITFEQAKKAAKVLRSKVVLGDNPAAEKQERKAIPTYREIAAQHLAYARTYQRRSSDTESIMRNHLLPVWGKRRINDIQTQEISAWLPDLASQGLAPATVEKIRSVFGRSFELAKKWKVPGAEHNPVRGLSRPKFNNARSVYLKAEQVEALLKAAERSPNKQLRAIIELLLFTGARRSELLNAKWEHIDLEGRAWHIPMSKNGQSRFVPLSRAAIEVLEALPTYTGCPYLIPNPDTREPYNTIKRAWDTARNEAGLAHVRLHDLRHSAASFMINGGTDLYAVGKVLGHADYKSTMRYSHLANETLLAAVEAGAAKLKGNQYA